jgi:hypothetical protein
VTARLWRTEQELSQDRDRRRDDPADLLDDASFEGDEACREQRVQQRSVEALPGLREHGQSGERRRQATHPAKR